MIDAIHLKWMRSNITPFKGGPAICLGDQQVSKATGFKNTLDLFKSFGCDRVTDIDYNGNALFNHNLNNPVPPVFHETGNIVYDGGTIEHVANIGTALSSMALMTKVGGYVIQESPVIPYGQAYYGIDPQIQRDFFKANGFNMLQQTLHYNGSYRMGILSLVVRIFPKRIADRLAARVRKIKGAKEFIFADTGPTHIYPTNFADKHCYYLHPQTRTFYLGFKCRHVEPTQWPSMECYPEA